MYTLHTYVRYVRIWIYVWGMDSPSNTSTHTFCSKLLERLLFCWKYCWCGFSAKGHLHLCDFLSDPGDASLSPKEQLEVVRRIFFRVGIRFEICTWYLAKYLHRFHTFETWQTGQWGATSCVGESSWYPRGSAWHCLNNSIALAERIATRRLTQTRSLCCEVCLLWSVSHVQSQAVAVLAADKVKQAEDFKG